VLDWRSIAGATQQQKDIRRVDQDQKGVIFYSSFEGISLMKTGLKAQIIINYFPNRNDRVVTIDPLMRIVHKKSLT